MKKKQLKISDNMLGMILILPTLIVLLTVVALPILKGIYVSFCEYTIGNLDAPVWNSFQNYAELFKKGEIIEYFRNTIVYVLLAVSIQFILGMAIALLLNSKMKGQGLLRALFLIPWTIPSVVVSIVFLWMLHQQFGVLNYLLHAWGFVEKASISWTKDKTLAMAMVVMAAVWRQLPYMMVMILAALQSVDRSLLEAARVDGAGSVRIFRSITLPLIKPVISTTVWIAVLSNFQMFTIVYNMTGGGPLDSTTTVGIAAYRKAFQSYNFGEAAAIGVLWLILLFTATLVKNHLEARSASDL